MMRLPVVRSRLPPPVMLSAPCRLTAELIFRLALPVIVVVPVPMRFARDAEPAPDSENVPLLVLELSDRGVVKLVKYERRTKAQTVPEPSSSWWMFSDWTWRMPVAFPPRPLAAPLEPVPAFPPKTLRLMLKELPNAA